MLHGQETLVLSRAVCCYVSDHFSRSPPMLTHHNALVITLEVFRVMQQQRQRHSRGLTCSWGSLHVIHGVKRRAAQQHKWGSTIGQHWLKCHRHSGLAQPLLEAMDTRCQAEATSGHAEATQPLAADTCMHCKWLSMHRGSFVVDFLPGSTAQ